ncbi:MAG: SPFH domain-containing protein, partial [Cellulosilyticaceae bacterium]
MDFKDPNNVIIDVDFNKQLSQFTKQFKSVFKFLIFAIILLILLLSSVYRLSTGTVGVITRFGAVKGINEQAGIHFKIPFIDKVQQVDVQTVHKMEYGYRT